MLLDSVGDHALELFLLLTKQHVFAFQPLEFVILGFAHLLNLQQVRFVARLAELRLKRRKFPTRVAQVVVCGLDGLHLFED